MIAGLVLASSPAFAQPSPADQLFKEGLALFEARRFTEACPKLAETQRLEPSPKKLAYLALCHRDEGKTATAWRELVKLAEEAKVAALRAEEAKAIELAAALEPRLSRLKLEVTSPIPGLQVTRGGVVVPDSELGQDVALDPGEYVIVATAPGHDTWSATMRLEGEGVRREVRIPVLTSTAATTATPVAPRVARAEPDQSPL